MNTPLLVFAITFGLMLAFWSIKCQQHLRAEHFYSVYFQVLAEKLHADLEHKQ
jgi:hypothetical protein